MSSTDQILSEFIDAWNAGERPRVQDYLARAPGDERDALARQLTTWLEVAPVPAYSEAARAEIRSSPAVAHVLAAVGDDAGSWPTVIPALRERAGLSVRDVASRLVARLGLASAGASAETRTTDYLERLERGDLEPSRVSRRLLDALGDLLGTSAATLREAGALGGSFRPAAAGGTLFRAERSAGDWVVEDIEAISRAAMSPAPEPLDEIDRLFMGGPEG